VTEPSNTRAPRTDQSERWGRLVWRLVIRYGPPSVFPVVAAITAAVAGVNHGHVRVYWTLGAVGATAGTAILSGLKERQAAISAHAAKTAIEIKKDLAMALARAGEPLVTALGNATAATSPDDRREALSGLMHLVVDVAASRCGRNGPVRGNVRSVLYLLSDTGLERKCYTGRQENSKPRKSFIRGTQHDELAIQLARSDDVLVVEDLENDPPKGFVDHKTKSYKSFISVPVKAGDTSLGLLCVDSDRAFSLNDVDRGYLVLLAGLLAAGIAHLTTTTNGAPLEVPRQNGKLDGNEQIQPSSAEEVHD
jgi:GAF domain-containing protein